jgi:hypothetical protein
LLKVCCFRGADRCFLLFEQCFVGIRFNLHKQIAFFHLHSVLDRELGNFPGNFRRNFDFGFGLYLARRGHSLQNGPSHRFLRCHWDRLLAFAGGHQSDDQKRHRAGGPKKNLAPATSPALFRGLTRKWGSGQGLVHGTIAYGAEAISL